MPKPLIAILLLAASLAAAAENPFSAPILDARPRIFLRAGNFDGLTVDKLRKAAATPEFATLRPKWRGTAQGRALLWLLDQRDEDLQAALAGLRKADASGGTWSDRGLALIDLAVLYDWLHPQLDPATRKQAIARLEAAADAAVDHIQRGQAPFYYTRTPGALAGMTIAGLALHGDSPKAQRYLDLCRTWGVNDYFKACEWVDGAATGATYTLFYTYFDLPALCAAWWSATGQNPTDWIRQNQGDWLDKMVQFNLWYQRPGFAFTDINDQFRDNFATHDQYCRALDLATYVTRNPLGRAYALRWQAKHGAELYHTAYAWSALFRDPALAPASLLRMPRAQLFGRESCGYGFFRSDWPADGQPDTATHVFFRMGDPMDVHGGVAAGEFQVFKYAPLASRSGKYGNYDSEPDQYHRNCISANVVLFTDPSRPDDRGDQNTRRGLKSDHCAWADWLAIRERNGLDVATITDWSVAPSLARCRADLTKANAPERCRQWIRELAWVDNRHLVVLDIVETPRPGIRHAWQLHSDTPPRLSPGRTTVENAPPARKWADPALQPKDPRAILICQTLLPRAYRTVVLSPGKSAAFDERAQPQPAPEPNPFHLKFARNVTQIDPGPESTRTIYLHILTAADAASPAAPECASRLVRPGQLELSVGEAKLTFEVPDWVK